MKDDSDSPPLGAALRRIGDASLRLLATRIELASVELGQAQRTVIRWFALSLAAGLLLLLAIVAATAAAVIAFWPTLGWLGLVLFALIYGGIAIALGYQVQREVASAPGVLAATAADLKADLALLQVQAQATAQATARATAAPAPAGAGEAAE